MRTLGINAVYHDSAACLVVDGQVIAAAEEERFTRIKHGKRPVPFSTWELPFHAIDYCLREGGNTLADIDHVAYSYDPHLLLGEHAADATLPLPLRPGLSDEAGEWESPWDPLFLSAIVNAPRQLVDGPPHHLQERFRGAAQGPRFRWSFVDHHLAHEASAFLAAPFDGCAVMTIDGRGERTGTSYGVFREGSYRRIGEVPLPHSLGLLYEKVTQHLGFLHSSDEYKVMALASYGAPRVAERLRELVRWCGDGQFTVAACDLTQVLGPARERGAPLDARHFDVARSLQEVLEERVLEMSRWLRMETGSPNLAMAGGVALNCVMNARIRDDGPFERVWVQPAAGDAGTALGAALWIDHLQGAGHSDGNTPYRMDHAYLGPEYDEDAIEDFLRWSKLAYRRMDDVAAEVSAILAEDRIVGWFQGRMEFGPRALGARSILASPIHPDMQVRLNEIKDREDFRPVAPVVLEEEAPRWFRNCGRSPFMLFVYDVLPEVAERIPAVRHFDGSARVQTVRRDQLAAYYDLIKAFAARTGVPVLVNTSFNTRGEPIVCSPRDAVECFWSSPLDALALGPFLLEKRSA